MPQPRLEPITDGTKRLAAQTGCEMAESETPCAEMPVYFLWSESYVKPMACCRTHAEGAIFYQDAVVFETASVRMVPATLSLDDHYSDGPEIYDLSDPVGPEEVD